MSSKTTSNQLIGVIGAGSFGTAIANILAEQNNVLLYVRDSAKAKEIEASRKSSNQKLSENITVTSLIREVGENCEVIFPIVPYFMVLYLFTLSLK